jgi:hypothetical protein
VAEEVARREIVKAPGEDWHVACSEDPLDRSRRCEILTAFAESDRGTKVILVGFILVRMADGVTWAGTFGHLGSDWGQRLEMRVGDGEVQTIKPSRLELGKIVSVDKDQARGLIDAMLVGSHVTIRAGQKTVRVPLREFKAQYEIVRRSLPLS